MKKSTSIQRSLAQTRFTALRATIYHHYSTKEMRENAVMHEESDLKNEIWSQEVAYWEYLKATDIDAFMSLWHDDFIGWPNNQPVLANKAGMHQLVAGGLDAIQIKSVTYELNPLSVRVFDDIGIVYYKAHVVVETVNGEEIATHERFTHTWLHTADGWKIIAGMSASLTS
jgi:ketosteroid isomerase-like protein